MQVTNLNNLGEVVGYWEGYPYVGEAFAFLYSNSTMINLEDRIGGVFNVASDINDNRQIVGWSGFSGGAIVAYIFSLAEGAQYLTQPYIDGEPVPSRAIAINNVGQIVGSMGGTYYGQGGLSECIHDCPVIFFQNGTITPLVPPSYTLYNGQAYDINDYYDSNGVGQIVGFVGLPSAPYQDQGVQAFLYSGQEMINISSICPPKTGAGSIAGFINNGGQITGDCLYKSISSGFIYNSTNGFTYYFGEDQRPTGINDAGWVVGSSLEDPFLLMNGTFHNILDLIPSDFGINKLFPVAINNQGQIAGSSNLGGVLLTPIN